jgi:hypothetical protein
VTVTLVWDAAPAAFPTPFELCDLWLEFEPAQKQSRF